MSLSGYLQKAVHYIKGIQDIFLFSRMSNSRLFTEFGASPLFYILLPFIGLLLTINALLSGYRLHKAHNKNVDQWLNFIASSVCAALASVSLYGAAIAAFWGFSFPAGPWLFFVSLLLASAQQTIMLSLNLYRAFESLKGSAQRMHYIQAALNNVFLLGLVTSILGAVIFVMLTPVAPLIGSLCAITAASLTVVDIFWRVLPHNLKLAIKGKLNLAKPESVQNVELQPVDEVAVPDVVPDVKPVHSRLFSCCDYRAEIEKLPKAEVKPYLQNLVNNKMDALRQHSAVPCVKSENKIALLGFLSVALNNSSLPRISKESKACWLKDYPLAFQSFFAEKGDVEQIFDAVEAFLERNHMEDLDIHPAQTI